MLLGLLLKLHQHFFYFQLVLINLPFHDHFLGTHFLKFAFIPLHSQSFVVHFLVKSFPVSFVLLEKHFSLLLQLVNSLLELLMLVLEILVPHVETLSILFKLLIFANRHLQGFSLLSEEHEQTL